MDEFLAFFKLAVEPDVEDFTDDECKLLFKILCEDRTFEARIENRLTPHGRELFYEVQRKLAARVVGV